MKKTERPQKRQAVQTTFRLPESLKARLHEGAKQMGVSVNTYVIMLLEKVLGLRL